MTDRTQALSFGVAAARYDRFRPGYPAEAVRWAIGGPPPRRVVDLGAGTGILTRVALDAGYDVVAVEPDPAMRAQLAAATPGVRPLAGFAEEVALPDAAADAVLAGQAYHWFDPERAHPEIARLIRPGGYFGAIWNRRDDTEPWVAELAQVALNADHDAEPTLRLDHPSFGPVERAVFTHRTTHTPDSLLAMIATRSYYLTATPALRAKIDSDVRELTATHPDLAGRETFEVPYRVIVYRAPVRQVLRS